MAPTPWTAPSTLTVAALAELETELASVLSDRARTSGEQISKLFLALDALGRASTLEHDAKERLARVFDAVVAEASARGFSAEWLAWFDFTVCDFHLRHGFATDQVRDRYVRALERTPESVAIKGWLHFNVIQRERELERYGEALRGVRAMGAWIDAHEDLAGLDVRAAHAQAEFGVWAWLGLADLAGAALEREREIEARVAALPATSGIDAAFTRRQRERDEIAYARMCEDYRWLERRFDELLPRAGIANGGARAGSARAEVDERAETALAQQRSSGADGSASADAQSTAPSGSAERDARASSAGEVLDLRIERALVRVEMARKGLRPAAEARVEIETLLDELPAGAARRAELLVAAAFAALDARDHARATTWIDALETAARASASDRFEASAAVLRARLAAEAVPSDPAVLSAALARLEGAADRLCVRLETAPDVEAGVGLFHFAARQAVVSELVRLSLLVHGVRDGIELSLALIARMGAAGSLARKLGARAPADRAAIEALVPARGALLVLFPARDRSHLFVLARGSAPRHVELAPSYELEARRAALHEHIGALTRLGDLDVAAFDAARVALSRALFPADLHATLERCEELTLVGFDQIGYTPVELCPLADGTTIGERCAVASLPSLAVGRALLERAARRTGAELDLVLVGLPDVSARDTERFRLAPLPVDADELAQLADGFARERVVVRTRAAATRDAWSALDASMLLVFGHGVLDAQRVRPAGLALAPSGDASGTAWCDDIEAGRSPPFVYLDACNAGAGPLRRGDDGSAHLGGAFLAAGADTVALAFVEIEARSSLELAALVQHELARGSSPAQALRDARRALSPDERARASLMHVVGLGHHPVFGARDLERRGVPSWAIAAAAAGCVLALVAVWMRRSRRSSAAD